jgi:hypothetical protein
VEEVVVRRRHRMVLGTRTQDRRFGCRMETKSGDSGGQRGTVCGGNEELVGLLGVGEEVQVQ